MKLNLLLLLTVCLTGCLTSRTDPTKYTDLLTGREYNQQQWDSLGAEEKETIRKGNQTTEEDGSILNRLLSSPILILFAVGSLVLIFGAVISGYHLRFVLSGCCAVGALLSATMPVMIIVFFKAMMIILYVAGGLLIICSGIVIYYIWKKMDAKHKKAQAVNKGLFATVEEIKSAYPDEWDGIKGSIKKMQCDVTTEAYKEFKDSK